VGALAALGFAERAPTRLALLGTLPRKRRKREREESYAHGAPPLPLLRGRVGVGALAALGFAERAPTRLALLGTLPRKREREESYADGAPPLPLFAGEGWGGGAQRECGVRGESPHPPRSYERVGLPRKRERRKARRYLRGLKRRIQISNSERICVRILAARCARGLHQLHPPSERRAQGKPDADRTRGRAHKKRTSGPQVQPDHSGFPCANGLRLTSCSPR
jgi:hypothetical protein